MTILSPNKSPNATKATRGKRHGGPTAPRPSERGAAASPAAAAELTPPATDAAKAPKRRTTTPATRGTRPSSRKAPKRRAPSAVVAKPRAPGAPVTSPRTTKQERVLTLLSRPDGAGLDELMQATGWQKHSVRGFLAGTVKKKLGLKLTSSKADGEARRYRVEARSAR